MEEEETGGGAGKIGRDCEEDDFNDGDVDVAVADIEEDDGGDLR